jgi:hypothetical protein
MVDALITRRRLIDLSTLVGETVKARVVQVDRVRDEPGEHVGTVLRKSFGKMKVYCFSL